MNEIYKGYLIREVFRYDSGLSDFEVFPDEGGEPGCMYHLTTIEDIKNELDEKTESL